MGDSPRILVVDDDETRRELLSIVLATAADGLQVELVEDPVALGAALVDGRTRAVVAAWPCSWLPGLQLLDRLRGALPDTPLVLLAEDGTEELIRRALRLHVADFVQADSGAPLRLRDAIRRLLRHPATEATRPRGPTPGSGDRRAAAPTSSAEDAAPTLPGAHRPAPTRDERRRTSLGPPTGPSPTEAPELDPPDAPAETMGALGRKTAPAGDAPTEIGGPGLDLLLDEAGLGWFRCQPDGRLLDANPALLTLVGAGDLEEARRRLPRLGFGEARWSDFVARVRDEGQVTESRLELCALDGEKRFVNLTLRGASAGRGLPVVDGLVLDQTETERLWERLGELRAGDMPGAGVITLDQRRRRRPVPKGLEPVGLATDKEQLLGLSHDLQEPARSLRIYAELLQENHAATLDDDAREMLARSRDAAARVEGMVSELLHTARLGVRDEPRTADAEAVLDEVLGTLAGAVAENGGRITHSPLPRVGVPPSQLRQLLQNLVGNALRYRSEAPPAVHLKAERGPGEWLFEVSDNGVGIPEEVLPRVFDMFERGAAAESLPGSGIGLTVCRRVVEGHGGRIWVESTEGEGSVFRFTLPSVGSTESAVR